MSKKSKFALLAGLAAGALSGILFAPSKGKEFRKKLKQEVKAGGYGNKSLWRHFKGMAQEIKNAATEVGLDDKAKEAWQETKTRAKKAKGKAGRKLKKASKKVKSKTKEFTGKIGREDEDES